MLIPSLLVAGALIEFAIATGFAVWLGRPTHSHHSSLVDDTDEAWIVLTLRGCDPTLPESLNGLANQSWANRKICVVIDSDEDPAWDVVRSFLATNDNKDCFYVRTLQKPLADCSLKCSAVAEAAEWIIETHPDAKFIALVDADVRPHQDLLNELSRRLRSARRRRQFGCSLV